MRNITRKPVTEEDFFERPKVIKKIWKLLDAKNSILLSGPPNCGKTSILLYLRDNPAEHLNPIYTEVGDIDKVNDYYERIQLKLALKIFLFNNIEIAKKKKNNFYEEILEMIDNYHASIPLVIMIDNFSEMLENIYKHEGTIGVDQFLNIEKKFRKAIETSNLNVQFIYSSSGDLESIAHKYNARQHLSDLYSFHIPPLSQDEAEVFINKLSVSIKLNLIPSEINYLCNKIPCLYPFNIQLALFELDSIYVDKDFPMITYQTIDEAINHVLTRNDYIGPKDSHQECNKVIKKFKKIKLQRIKIQHVKCFEEIEMKLDTSINTTLIVGTNGKGKSTILQLIALGLSGIKNIPFPYNWKEVVKKNSSRGLFEIDILFEDDPIQLKFEIDNDDTISCTQGSEHLETIGDNFMLLAYGVNRSYKLEETRPYKDMEPIATLFGENGYLKHIKISANFEYIKQHFKTIQILINKVLEKANHGDNVILNSYDPHGFYFITPSNLKKAIPMEALSEGFKSTLVWLLDAIIRIVEKGGRLENASEITGIILLDEVDLHLHPSWQRTILQSIENLFPNIQFIVTTHSPFVVQSANMESLIVLEMDQNSSNVIVVDKNITSNLSYNAVVREIFAVKFPFNREIELEMDEFRRMQDAIRDNQSVDMEKFHELISTIASKGVELEGIMRREIMNLEQRIGKSFNLWKK
ncbi:MAG: AAA family ATPase [Acidobacteria bacterium]|jgi:predicted ATP-binding protein involved in virulence|nr:AAA family ATPase [Acidobacteriota bacterium]